MSGVDPTQFRLLVVRPALQRLDLWTQAAENLVLGTAVHESRLVNLHQLGGGPADGFFQIEPRTHNDLFANTLPGNPALKQKLLSMAAPWPSYELQLTTNLLYEAAVCRLLYWRHPAPLPAADDIDGLAAYWKQYYNTPQGAGRAEVWASEYRSLPAWN